MVVSERQPNPWVGARAVCWLLATTFAALAVACGPSQQELTQTKQEAVYHYQLAHGFYFDRKGANGDAALQEVLKSIAIDPDNADARLLAGLVFMGRERYLDAIGEFKRAVELRPKFHFALNNLGATYLALGQWDEAIAVFDQLVATITYSTPGHGHNNLGWAHHQKGDREAARRHYLAAIQLAPALCPPYNNLGMLWLEAAELDRAEKYLRRGIKRCPSYAEPYFHLGRLNARRAQPREAVSNFKRCADLSGESPLADRCQSRLASLQTELIP